MSSDWFLRELGGLQVQGSRIGLQVNHMLGLWGVRVIGCKLKVLKRMLR